jgi:hypothetical protein
MNSSYVAMLYFGKRRNGGVIVEDGNEEAFLWPLGG